MGVFYGQTQTNYRRLDKGCGYETQAFCVRIPSEHNNNTLLCIYSPKCKLVENMRDEHRVSRRI